MTLKERLNERLSRQVEIDADEQRRIAEICDRVPGWSGPAHYAFFRELLELPIRTFLMLGVYHGRDLTFVADILKHRHPRRDIVVIGVDRFTPDACADWLPVKGPRTWEQETRGMSPPDFNAACRNVGDEDRIIINRSDDCAYLDETPDEFCAIYFDTAHDYATLARQIRQARRVLIPGGVLCGDDFSDQYTWGVKSAVEHHFSEYNLFGGWIWAAFYEDAREVAR